VVVSDASKREKEEGAFPRIVQTKRQRISSPVRIGNAILNPMFLYTPILKPFSAVEFWTFRISDTHTIVPFVYCYTCLPLGLSVFVPPGNDNSCGITDTTAPPYSRIADALCPRKIIFILCDIIGWLATTGAFRCTFWCPFRFYSPKSSFQMMYYAAIIIFISHRDPVSDPGPLSISLPH
jgi:hypothetical protein